MGRNKKLQEIDLSLNSLVIFRKLLTHEVILPLRALLDTEAMDPIIQLRQYTEFVSRLYSRNVNLTEYIFQLICLDDNYYVKAVAAGEEIDPMLEASVQNELAILQRLSRLRPHELQKEVSYYGILPEWKTSDIDFGAEYHARLRDIRRYGFGKFADSSMFIIQDERCVPVQHPDTVTLKDLKGYETKQAKIIDNTARFMSDIPAQHCLLYGDSGTGKSAVIKAVLNSFSSQGLRLIQVQKEQLSILPEILDLIHDNPLKFIIYVDDMDMQDSSYSLLKNMMEGAAAKMPSNALVYATVNGDITAASQPYVQSFAERFGLRICFGEMSQSDFADLVAYYAEKANLPLPQLTDDMSCKRTPRTAKQLAEMG
ncbi:MAG: ATP-binding protein [Oscillospiraceae bacterium]|nr:ATP-binding protein [Oscillospiraceae bacterium]